MRIAFCVPEFQPLQAAMQAIMPSPAYLLLANIATSLQGRGHELSFIGQYNLGNYVCTKELTNPQLAGCTWSDSKWFHYLQNISWHMQKGVGIPYLNMFANLRLYDACLRCLPGHDVVYERSGLYKDGVARTCRRLRIPYVLFVEADEVLEFDYQNRSLSPMLRWRAHKAFRYNLNAAGIVLCVSSALRNHLMGIWKISGDKIHVIPNAADFDKFHPDLDERSRMRTYLNVGDVPVILFVGSFFKWHDVETLLNAFGMLLRAGADGRLLLVGDGSMRIAMEQRAVEIGYGSAVRFIGGVKHSDVASYLAAADISVVPYPNMKHEMWMSPLKLFEYMASGKAIIASAVGQVLDIIQDGRNGLLVPPGDASGMAEAMKKLIRDAELRARLGQQARADAVERYSWNQYISRLEGLLETAKDL